VLKKSNEQFVLLFEKKKARERRNQAGRPINKSIFFCSIRIQSSRIELNKKSLIRTKIEH